MTFPHSGFPSGTEAAGTTRTRSPTLYSAILLPAFVFAASWRAVAPFRRGGAST